MTPSFFIQFHPLCFSFWIKRILNFVFWRNLKKFNGRMSWCHFTMDYSKQCHEIDCSQQHVDLSHSSTNWIELNFLNGGIIPLIKINMRRQRGIFARAKFNILFLAIIHCEQERGRTRSVKWTAFSMWQCL